MNESFQSALWYRVAGTKPRLRRHARFFRTHFRGELWYVLQDRVSGRFHRFSPSSYFIACLLDGMHTLDEIWQIARDQLTDDMLTQDEIIQLLGQLHSADVLHAESVPDIGEVVDRGRSQRSRKRLMSVMNPLAIRVPLFDPEGFLKITTPLVRPFISVFGLILFLGIVGYGGTLAVLNWEALTANVLDRLLSAQSLVLILITYPAVKALHELGHAYAITRWGGEVHEIGLMFLVFVPVPYVDASDSLSFQNKWQRAFVAGAGILVEMLLAAIAMIVWLNAENGLVTAFAFNVMLIGGVSTLLFNGNPLLRFDGYYVLSDLIEIPNLGTRANQYIGYLVQKRLLGITEARNPATAPGEPAWFVVYGVAAFIYRLFITAAIILLVSSMFFSLGILLAVWALVLMFIVPLAKHVWFLLSSPRLRHRRGRALGVVLGVLGTIAVLLVGLPLPYSTIAEGVVWIEGEGAVHAGADGIVSAVDVAQGQEVVVGQVLVRMTDPLLDARVKVLETAAVELELRRQSLSATEPAAARIAQSELERARADLALALDRQEALIVRADIPGRVVLIDTTDLPGQFLTQGRLLGYVSNFRNPLIRTVVGEGDSDLILQETRRIDIRFTRTPNMAYPAQIEREVPALDAVLPSLALATVGGGNVVLDPASASGMTALGNLLHLDLRLEQDYAFETIGDRAYVRFVHEPTSLSARFYRRLRQVFLRHFNI